MCNVLLVIHCIPKYVYLVPLLTYSALSTVVTLEPALDVTQGH